MHKTLVTLALVFVFLGLAAPVNGDEKEERDKAIAYFKSLKAEVVIAENPKKIPEVRINFINTRVKDDDLAKLKAIPDLTELNLGGTKITDKGLELSVPKTLFGERVNRNGGTPRRRKEWRG
jgi:hypothetical protein